MSRNKTSEVFRYVLIQDFKIYLKTLRHIYKCNKRSFFK
jgi:hypothetical protein